VDELLARDARHHQNAPNSSADHQPSKESAFVQSMAENQPGRKQMRGSNAAQQQKPFMAGKHARSVGLEQKNLGN